MALVGSSRASLADLALAKIVVQDSQTIEWRGNPKLKKEWKFSYPEHLHKVMIYRGTGDRRRLKIGTICACCDEDINEGRQFKVLKATLHTYLNNTYYS